MRSALVPRVLVWLFDVTRRSGRRSRVVRSLSPSIGARDRTLDLLSGRIAVLRPEPQLFQPPEDPAHMTHPSTLPALSCGPITAGGPRRCDPGQSGDIPGHWPKQAMFLLR